MKKAKKPKKGEPDSEQKASEKDAKAIEEVIREHRVGVMMRMVFGENPPSTFIDQKKRRRQR